MQFDLMILILLVVTFFLIFKLLGVLGNDFGDVFGKEGEESFIKGFLKKYLKKEDDSEKSDELFSEGKTSVTPDYISEEMFTSDEVEQNFKAIFREDVSVVSFLDGAKNVFKILLESLNSKKEPRELSEFVHPVLRQKIEKSWENNKNLGIDVDVRLYKILSAKIVECGRKDDYDTLRVLFDSEQFTSIEGSSGSKETIKVVRRDWVEFIKKSDKVADHWLAHSVS